MTPASRTLSRADAREVDGALESLVAELTQADASLAARGFVRRSLAPDRTHATPLAELARAVVTDAAPRPELARSVCHAFGRALADLGAAAEANFPGNLYADVDFVAACLWNAALAQGAGGATSLGEHAALMVELHELFGRRTPIHFRYVHDLLYGFDWARWVRREPEERADIGPFDPVFLRAMRARASELVQLIAENDEKYHRIPEGTARNPFFFSREPDDEARLHEDLATRGIVPVEAWRRDAVPRADVPFSDLREARARELGLFLRR